MTTIHFYVSECTREAIHERLDYISQRIPCIATYSHSVGRIIMKCRREDIPFIEKELAEFI